MSAHTFDIVSQLVSVLTLSARIAESGSITHLPETVRPVGWAAHYAGAELSWERVAEARVSQEVAPLLAEIASAELPADVAHRYASVESWRRAAVAETRRIAGKEAYERVVGEMRREALAAIDAKGAAFQPVEWEESARVFRVQGEWTVTVSVSGSDHTAVREAFAAGLSGRRDEILAGEAGQVCLHVVRIGSSARKCPSRFAGAALLRAAMPVNPLVGCLLTCFSHQEGRCSPFEGSSGSPVRCRGLRRRLGPVCLSPHVAAPEARLRRRPPEMVERNVVT
ncbi:hypothetical protein [Streptomyces xantholiticus]|uniref:hypothetical protein n=1 Tax=Streptomyces xantholiticus TaxID=68285 RepID=UPI00167962EE|nr:hypothetical protein [Streptomyces xantholiticus]GGW69861.1 hypothetical protein GCM10010381_63330 [Streptomyces xantholiticus]